MSGVVYDAGALIAAERNDRRFARLHQRYLEAGVLPVVPAAVLAQAWAGGARQALTSRVLHNCVVEPLTDSVARSVGALRVQSGATDVVDVSVVECAIRHRAAIITSDPNDIHDIVASLIGRKPPVEPI